MISGLVSNCWNWELENGKSLVDLIQEAVERGFTYVELRQYSLGSEFETEGTPQPAQFQRLGEQFPGVEFDLAIALPFLDASSAWVESPLFQASREACVLLAGDQQPPHLRLVDLSTTEDEANQLSAESGGQVIADMAEKLLEVGGVLSIEHSIQRWTVFRSAFDAARAALSRRGLDNTTLQICFDPCNLLLPTQERPDAEQVTRSLTIDQVSMIHFKQRITGAPSPSVSDGEIDWSSVCTAIAERKLEVPFLLEIPGGEGIWDRVEASQAYLAKQGLPG
jgi:sugar phosphate isomerase/epimerase